MSCAKKNENRMKVHKNYFSKSRNFKIHIFSGIKSKNLEIRVLHLFKHLSK